MTLTQALVIAVLQGATELFPVSSLGHAVILPRLLSWNIDQHAPEFLPFLVVLHLGTAAALLAYFWRDWLGFFMAVIGQGEKKVVKTERRVFALVCIATVPAVVLGFALEHYLTQLVRLANTGGDISGRKTVSSCSLVSVCDARRKVTSRLKN